MNIYARLLLPVVAVILSCTNPTPETHVPDLPSEQERKSFVRTFPEIQEQITHADAIEKAERLADEFRRDTHWISDSIAERAAMCSPPYVMYLPEVDYIDVQVTVTSGDCDSNCIKGAILGSRESVRLYRAALTIYQQHSSWQTMPKNLKAFRPRVIATFTLSADDHLIEESLSTTLLDRGSGSSLDEVLTQVIRTTQFPRAGEPCDVELILDIDASAFAVPH